MAGLRGVALAAIWGRGRPGALSTEGSVVEPEPMTGPGDADPRPAGDASKMSHRPPVPATMATIT